MEYEFFRSVEGRPSARLSMGHEMMGPWLTDEIDKQEVEQLLVSLAQVNQGTTKEITRHYAESTLIANGDEAELKAHALAFEHHDLQEDMVYYDAELQAGCGLADLVIMLEQWRAFINE